MADYAVITTHNEAETIYDLIAGLHQLGLSVIVVDERSTDGTPDIAWSTGADLIHRQGGIGPCLMEGWRAAIEAGATRILQIDAGGSHDPLEAKRLLDVDADIVIGSRFVPGGVHNGPRWRQRVSRAYAQLWNRYYNTPIRDWTSGYRCFTAEAAQALDKPYRSSMHAWQAEVLAEACELELSIVEVPITYTGGRSSLSPSVAWEAVKAWWTGGRG